MAGQTNTDRGQEIGLQSTRDRLNYNKFWSVILTSSWLTDYLNLTDRSLIRGGKFQ